MRTKATLGLWFAAGAIAIALAGAGCGGSAKAARRPGIIARITEAALPQLDLATRR